MASDKGVIPATDHAEKTHKDIKQQCRPDLPTDRVCAVAQEVAQLQALLDLFKKHFDLPAAAIQISHTGGAPLQIVSQKLHLALLAVDFHQSPHSTHGLGIIGAGVFVFKHHKFVAQDAFISCFGQSFDHPKAQRLLTARHPKDTIAIEHAQVDEINVGPIKNNDLARFNSGADFRGTNAVGGPCRFDQDKAREQTVQV